MNLEDEVRRCAAVMLAYADGKTIQYRLKHCEPGDRFWQDHVNPTGLNWRDFEYRVKPEPMEIEVWVSPDGRVIEYNAMVPGWTKKKFREVIE